MTFGWLVVFLVGTLSLSLSLCASREEENGKKGHPKVQMNFFFFPFLLVIEEQKNRNGTTKDRCGCPPHICLLPFSP